MDQDLLDTIGTAKRLIVNGKFMECEAIICTLMFQHPHDPVPHNLMGLMYEAMDQHAKAMRHFRAAYDLDPEFRPATWNMECFGSGYQTAHGAYYDADCTKNVGSVGRSAV